MFAACLPDYQLFVIVFLSIALGLLLSMGIR